MSPIKAILLALIGGAAWAGPQNDHFQNATVLAGADTTFIVDTYLGTVEPGEPAHSLSPLYTVTGPALETVWYRWTAPGSGMVQWAVEEQYSLPAVYFASSLYRGNALANLEEIPRTEGPGTSTYLWPVAKGETYSLAVGAQHNLPQLWPTTNRLRFIPPFRNTEFRTRPLLATNLLSAVYDFGPTNDSGTPPPDGELLWWRLLVRTNAGTARLVFYNSGPGEWFIYKGGLPDHLQLIDQAGSEETPSSVESYFLVEPGVQYNLAFRPLGATRRGVFGIYSYFTSIWLTSSAGGETIQSGTNLVLNFEGLPGTVSTNAMLTLYEQRHGSPLTNPGRGIAGWRPPFPTNFVITNVTAGNLQFTLIFNDTPTQTAELARLGVVVNHRNDHFASALPVTGNAALLNVSLEGATVEAGEPALPNGGDRTVWFSWIAPESGRLVVRDWRIDAFTGNSLETLVPAEEAFGSSDWENTYVVQGGVTYYLRAIGGEWWSATDRQVWLVPASARPTNDDFANALTLTGTNLVRSSSVYGATVQSNEPINPITGTIWYRWTSPGRGSVQIFGNGMGQVEVFTGTTLGALEYWNWSNGVQPGQRLYIRHAGSSLETNNLTLSLEYFPSPPNDDFGAAIQLTGASGSVEASFAGASNETTEPAGWGGFVPPPAVWYRWAAPEAGYLHLEPRAQVRLFTYSAGFVEVTSRVNSANLFPVNAGQTYYVRFATGNSTTLRYEWLPTAVPNDFVENATVLSGTDVSFTARTFEATASEDDPTNALRTVWFQWHAPMNGTAQITTDGLYSFSSYRHRMVVLDENRTRQIASAEMPGTFSFPVSAGSNYLFMVELYRNLAPFSNRIPVFPDDSRGTVMKCWLSLTTYRLLSPAPDALFTTNDVIEARLSEPVEDTDPPYTKVTFYVPHPISGPDVPVESTNGVILLTNRVGNTRVSASVHLEDGRTINVMPVQYRVVDPGVPHDDFAERELLVGRYVRRPITSHEIISATFEPDEPRQSGDAPALWFRWVAPADGLASIGPISSESWPLVIRAWQGGSFSSSMLRPPVSGGSIIISPWPPIFLGDKVEVFRGTTLTNLEVVLGSTNVDRAFVAEAGVEYAIRFPALYNAKALHLHLTTVEVTEPATDDGYAWGEPVPIELASTERPEDLASLDVMVETNVAASFASAPFQMTLTNIAPGEHPWRTVLTLTSGETVTNEHPAIRVYPPNVTAETAVLVTTNFAFDVRGFKTLEANRGRTEGPPLYYRVRPAANLAVFTRQADLTVYPSLNPGADLTPYAFGTSEYTNSTWRERPVFELRAGTEYLLVVSNLFIEAGAVNFAPRPENDAIENASLITGTQETIPLLRNYLAREENEPGIYASVWYRWKSPGAGYIQLSQFPYVFAENDLTNALEYIPEAIPQYVFPVQPGVNYYIGFPHNWGDVPDETVDFRYLPAPVNDRVDSAISLRGTDVTLHFDFFGLRTDPMEVNHGSTNAIGSLWWRWLSPADGKLALSLTTLNGLVRANLYVRENGTNWTRVPEGVSRYSRWYSVVVGQEYYLALERLHSSGAWFPNRWEMAPTTLRLHLLRPPANDHFANAQPIASDVIVRGATHVSTAEPGEPAHAGIAPAQSVWFKWRAERDGMAYVKYFGSNTNTWSSLLRTVAVYRGSKLNELSAQAMQQAFWSWAGFGFEMQAGEEYSIAVDGRFGGEEFSLLVQTEPVALEIFTPRLTANGIEFDLPAVRNTPIVVEYSYDLVTWFPSFAFPPDHPGPFTVPLDEFNAHLFYRVSMQGLAPAGE